MKKYNYKKLLVTGLFIIFVTSSCIPAFGAQLKEQNKAINVSYGSEIKHIEFDLSFSNPEVVEYGDYWIVRVKETNHNQYVLFDIDPGKPVLPVNISVFELMFGSEIVDIEFEHSPPVIIDIPGPLAFSQASFDTVGTEPLRIPWDESIYEGDEPYPSDWVLNRTGGGLSQGEHTTFLTIRVYPVRFFPVEYNLQFISDINVNVSYIEPSEPILEENDIYDLLIIAPLSYKRHIKLLINHKEKFGIKTKFISPLKIYLTTQRGRDNAEKIKYYIKNEIEESGISYVLLFGGRNGQSSRWNIPVRYSRVVPPDEQEYPEQSFISDLYFADIFDGEGNFSSWDSNNDNVFSQWNGTFREEMDLYPDVYLGRLACRYVFEVKTMVKKIINYEKEPSDEGWFKNLILVAGDSYKDNESLNNVGVNEGEEISEKAITLMPDFNPVKVYAREGQDINRQTVNAAMDQGAGFAYFCGHGSAGSWSTHFPPDGKNWTTGYNVKDMIFLKNREKLPIAVVGGCHNGQFDVTLLNLLNPNAGYYSWLPKCWSWWLTSKIGGGAIATIANTGLGTHGDGDMDNNSIPDYLEILDGWLELRFLELYGSEDKDILGENHADALTGYLLKFRGDDAMMDVKMVQQWQLFGDPSLKIGGYKEVVIRDI
jgi:hypothetical protein